jgi:hypothetical protein
MRMTPEAAMLVAGIVVFVVALGLLIYCVVTRRPYKAVLFLFVIAIIMIGFPSIKSFKLPGGTEVDLARSLQAVDKNPNDPAAKARLEAAVAKVNRQPNITPQTRATLANAQLVLGQRDEATKNVKAALKAQPNLKIDPKLRALVKRPSPSG